MFVNIIISVSSTLELLLYIERGIYCFQLVFKFLLLTDSNGCGNYFFQDNYCNYDTINSFSQFLLQLEKKCAGNTTGEILLCNEALQPTINQRSSLFISL